MDRFLNRRSVLCFCCYAASALPVSVLGAATASAADPEVSPADRAFMAKVSQGGMFEVEAGKIASQKGFQQNIVDIGDTEVHDHQLVGAKLRSIAASANIQLDTALNAQFQTRLARLNSLSGAAFDNAFIMEMDEIHKLDGAAFAEEARSGSNHALRSFAAETALIVQRHLGSLDALPLEAT